MAQLNVKVSAHISWWLKYVLKLLVIAQWLGFSISGKLVNWLCDKGIVTEVSESFWAEP